MPTVLLPLQAGNLLETCFGSEQARLNAFAAALFAQLPGSSFFNFGDTLPDVSNNSYPWFRTIDSRWYHFSGDWISAVNYDDGDRRLYGKSLTDLLTYDGGDAGAASDRTGPMWVEDTDMIGRSPMHPGLLPGSSPSKTLVLDEDYGAGSHAQTIAELAAHTHALQWRANTSGTGSDNDTGTVLTPFTGSANVATVGSGTPMNMVHPVRGMYVIKWSGRLYRKV